MPSPLSSNTRDRPKGAATDLKLHRQLAAALKKATDEYFAVVINLKLK
jgi:hypothetical protein